MSVDRDALPQGGGESAESSQSPASSGLSPDSLIIVPVRNVVLFPGTVFPVAIGRERSILAAQQALREERQIGVLMQRDAEAEEPTGIDLHRTGTIANILRYVSAPDGSHHA